MARPKNPMPTYRFHKPSGSARTWVAGKWRTLGPYNSPESHTEYGRILSEFAAGAFNRPVSPASNATVNEVLLAYLKHAEDYYRRPDGTQTTEVQEIKASIKPVRELYGSATATEFGPLALKAVQARMVALGWCRAQVNRRIGRVKRVFRWCESEELIPPSVTHALATVAGLRHGRTKAKESKPVLPVEAERVAATLPHLNRQIRGLVEFQRLTGCRPGEACSLRRDEVDTTGPVWVYKPSYHKMSYKGRIRAVQIGPKAQALLAEYPTANPSDYVFSPKAEIAERNAKRALARVTPRYGKNKGFRKPKAKPERSPGECYDSLSYGRALRRACAANGIALWKPNQLRHLRATEVRSRFGLESAQVVLGTPAPT